MSKRRTTPKSKLARERNYNKFRLIGASRIVTFPGALTLKESVTLSKIESLCQKLIRDWDENSVALGLKVKPKCWCGKIGLHKAQPIDGERTPQGNFCKKHSIDWNGSKD